MAGDEYNFDIKPWLPPKNIFRNIETAIGIWVHGEGKPFYINMDKFDSTKNSYERVPLLLEYQPMPPR